MLTSLNENQWLDEDTDAIFFEQTYYNGNTNSFLMFRISWEHVKGGLYQGKALLQFPDYNLQKLRSATNKTASVSEC